MSHTAATRRVSVSSEDSEIQHQIAGVGNATNIDCHKQGFKFGYQKVSLRSDSQPFPYNTIS